MKRVGQIILDNFDFLNKLIKTKSTTKRQKILKLATTQELLSLIEAAYNILKGRFELTARQRSRLIPHIAVLRKLGRSRSERGAKHILQKGGGLTIIPAIITPILIEAFRLIQNDSK
jgi:hypothetical protein